MRKFSVRWWQSITDHWGFAPDRWERWEQRYSILNPDAYRIFLDMWAGVYVPPVLEDGR